MKTVDFDYVLRQACELTGRVYPPTTEEASAFSTYIGMALRQAWEAYDWGDFKLVSQEFFAPDYDSTQTYNSGNFIYFPTEQKYYQCVQNTTVGISPTSNGPNGQLNSANWSEALPDYAGVSAGTWSSSTSYTQGQIVLWAYDQNYYQCIVSSSGTTSPSNTAVWGMLNPFIRTISETADNNGTARTNIIGEVMAVYSVNPEVAWKQRLLNFSFYNGDILIGDQLPYVWVEYRIAPTNFSSGDPGAIPYRFQNIVALRSAGMMLKVDGKNDLGNELMAMGEAALTDEIDKVARQEMQTRQVIYQGR